MNKILRQLLLKSYLYHTIRKQQILAYKSKLEKRFKRENQVDLLMITNGEQCDKAEKWHYIALKSVYTADGFNRPKRSLSGLFRGTTANNNGNFYCFFILFRTNNALKKHERLCDNNDYCHVGMPIKDNNTLKYNHGEKPLKAPFTIYADLECLLIKEQFCQNNPKESYTERKAKHEPSAYSLSLIFSFNSNQNKHNVHRGRDCIETFCKD